MKKLKKTKADPDGGDAKRKRGFVILWEKWGNTQLKIPIFRFIYWWMPSVSPLISSQILITTLGSFAQNCGHWDPCTYNRGHNLNSSINIYLRQRYLRIAHGLIHSLLKTLICITLQAFNVTIHFYMLLS